MTQADTFDNRSRILKDDLTQRLRKGDRISIAAAYFSLYGFQELRRELEAAGDLRFIYTSPTFLQDRPTREQREFYIPRLDREQSLYGTRFEIRLRNELTQKAIARECAAWVRKKARFRSFGEDDALDSFMVVQHADGSAAAYAPFEGLTTTGLGTKPGTPRHRRIRRREGDAALDFLDQFNDAWNDGEIEDVTAQVLDSIEGVYDEIAPEIIYYLALYNIFSEFLDDVSQDVLPNEGTGWRNSAIWGKLYDFQRDAAVSIINKLETYNGCILADSVGLGKTFTALAVIKYYESRNRNVLVLCPKKLKDNWLTYRSNLVNNPLTADRLRYDVLFHTDLSRTRGDTVTGLPIDRINWGNYDLVVIDESHNFRNGAAEAVKRESGENRYLRLMNRIIKPGVKTKVLMLSATPVNNRFSDLRNQLALAYEGDDGNWQDKLGLQNDLDATFRNAQTAFNKWDKLPPDQRTTRELTQMLDYDFYKVLDQVTVARSRRHIQRHYDMSALGPFPHRNAPVSIRAKLTDLPGAINYHEIYQELEDLTLCVYMPSAYLQPSKIRKYTDEDDIEGLTIAGRENGIRKLMDVNLLKRLESSVNSFRITLGKVRGLVEATIRKIDRYKQTHVGTVTEDESPTIDWDADDEDEGAFSVGGKRQFDIADLDYVRWERDLLRDKDELDLLLSMVGDITPEHDAKLNELYQRIEAKVKNPINPGNRKVIVFTAFADTAAYLYENLAPRLKSQLGLETCLITGKFPAKCTLKVKSLEMNDLLTMFSPVSKERDIVMPKEHRSIDVLIATDCISEGQNLQDCDWLCNYDIHWNPVRVIQRFGRIDRIGSHNKVIQLVNFWPDVELDEYIRLRSRVEERMRVTVLTSTGDDDLLNANETGDLEYREEQLKRMMNEVVDLEDMQGGVSITDLGLNDFRMDLVEYYRQNPEIERRPHGLGAVVHGETSGVIFVLRNVNQGVNIKRHNQLHPYYLVYVGDDHTVVHGHLEPKAVLDEMRTLCRGKAEPDLDLCRAYNKRTRDGRDMRAESALLQDAISSIVEEKQESDLDSFFADGTTSFLEGDVEGLDDFELVCFLVVRP